ncbi:MAG: sigma-70 family RNA polymerase sigma factor [Phycisphaerae bacterium]|nr:sigma-70 family RNA polymerase sigma factor [Phycisphaerae bacterium]
MFDTTPATLFDQARHGGEAGARALGELFRIYRPAACRYVRGRFGALRTEADDIVSDFLVEKFVTGNMIWLYQPGPGRRFRAYFRKSLDRYCIDNLRKKKRRPQSYGLDERFDQPLGTGPDAFDVAWARQVLGRALRRLKRECEWSTSAGQRGAWEILKARFLRPFLGKPMVLYPELVKKCGFATPAVAQKAATLGKRMLATTINEILSEYAGSADTVSERDDLWQSLKRDRPGGPASDNKDEE